MKILLTIGTLCSLLFFQAFGYEAVLSDDATFAKAGKQTKTGGLATMAVNSQNRALLKFDISTLPATVTADNVLSATLTVFINKVKAPGAVSLSRILGNWDETALSGAALTFPSIGSQIGIISDDAKHTFMRFDVTGLVKGWRSGAFVNNGLALGADVSGTGISLLLDSKESTTTGHYAQLEINVATIASASIGGVTFRGTYDPTATYGLNELVQYKDNVFVVTGSTTGVPTAGSNGWTLLNPGALNYRGEFDESVTYAANDLAVYQGKVYVAGSSPTGLPMEGNGWALFAAQESDSIIYGDGSAGSFTAAGESNFDVSNPQFTSFAVTGTLHVPSGTTIRCMGSFTCSGKIIVNPAGGIVAKNSLNSGYQFSIPERGITVDGITPLDRSQLKSLTRLPLFFGASSVAARSDYVDGKDIVVSDIVLGGGSIQIIAKGNVSIPGIIDARGQDGIAATRTGGGGGGGILIASNSKVEITGNLNASGGKGAKINQHDGSGGGGGGFIRIIAPEITSVSSNIMGGENGTVTEGEIIIPGAASVGAGGYGIDLNTVFPATEGIILQDVCNPAALLLN